MSREVELQFESAERQHESAKLSLWVFLSTEVMFFAALFAAYAMYRTYYPEAFRLCSEHMERWLATFETADLLTSSFFMALAIHATRSGRRGLTLVFLAATMAGGFAFLGMHAHEYVKEFREGALPGRYYHLEEISAPGASMFFTCYFFMTGLHSLHVLIGIGLMTWLGWKTLRGRFSPTYYTPVENVGLYWHFVDMVWVFLYAMFYLVS